MNQINFNSPAVLALCRKYHVKTLRLFGSVARGDARTESDVDLLATFSKPISLLQMVRLEREISAIIGRNVDLLTVKSVSPYLRNRILKESRPVYTA
ncbi:MAG: nucleotidyltransferase family protein [Ignavibacteriales bacterium]|nr:nucleotidyltransferase family protein [Ignavibacteriales bacterium]